MLYDPGGNRAGANKFLGDGRNAVVTVNDATSKTIGNVGHRIENTGDNRRGRQAVGNPVGAFNDPAAASLGKGRIGTRRG